MRYTDLTGQRFGKLVAEKRYYDAERKITFWRCKCDCGAEAMVRANSLKHGRTKSCGCLRRDSNNTKKTTHGLSKTRIYNTWHAMKGRCKLESNANYPRYGGRGISVCKEWNDSFDEFYKWAMANGYQDGLSLDRIDNNGNYCPSNCRWVTRDVQNNNREVSRNITYNGETKNLAEWCREFGLPYLRIWERIYLYGYTFEEAIKEPAYNRCGKQQKEK